MSTMPRTASRPRPSAAARRAAAMRRRRRRRLGALLGVLAVTIAGIVVLSSTVDHAVTRLVLPLRHADIIRQQAKDKKLDAALIAGVIYTESRFRDQTSAAGAKGLMQITPATALYIEHLSGGTTFQMSDLSTPQVNISYGSFYLRYLLDHYDDNKGLALAAYNAGVTNMDRWLGKARAAGHALALDDIPFAETREYVRNVEAAQKRYRHTYAHDLGY